MAGSLLLIESETGEKPVAAFKDEWQIAFSRFVVYPSLPSSCSSLVLVPIQRRRPQSRGTWISSDSPTAVLRISNHQSVSYAVLTVNFCDYLLEEHYVSKLHFTWPKVSCFSGYPPRGTKTVFVSYKDSSGEFQKFAFRFKSVSEAEEFINSLKVLLNDSVEATPLDTEFQSEISSRFHEESSVMSPIRSNSDEIPLTLTYKVEGHSPTNTRAPTHHSESEYTALPSNFSSSWTDLDEMILNNGIEKVPFDAPAAKGYNNEGTSAALPPSFASLLANCYRPEAIEDTATAQPSSSKDDDLKSEIARLMEDSSFQEMLMKVEQVINEFGDDLSL